VKRERLDLDAYPFTIRPLNSEEVGGYLIEFPDVPGCISDGETPQEAIANGRDALKSALLTMKEFGRGVPRPAATAAASEQWRQRVPKSLHSRLVARAKQEGVSFKHAGRHNDRRGLGRRKAS